MTFNSVVKAYYKSGYGDSGYDLRVKTSSSASPRILTSPDFFEKNEELSVGKSFNLEVSEDLASIKMTVGDGPFRFVNYNKGKALCANSKYFKVFQDGDYIARRKGTNVFHFSRLGIES